MELATVRYCSNWYEERRSHHHSKRLKLSHCFLIKVSLAKVILLLEMATTSFYTLFESASGYGLFSVLESEEIGSLLQEVIFMIN